MTRTILMFLLLAVIYSGATRVNNCDTGRRSEDEQSVQITSCDIPPCKLEKLTKVGIKQRFTPNHKIENLITRVHATILIIPLPFVGVDGTSACPKIFKADGTTFNGCPLNANEEYVYKNEFDVYQIYPSVPLTVRWELSEKINNTFSTRVTCFDVPAKITEPSTIPARDKQP